MKTLSWVNFVLGVWLVVAAFVLPVRTGPIMAEESVNAMLVGLLVLGLGTVNAFHRHMPARTGV